MKTLFGTQMTTLELVKSSPSNTVTWLSANDTHFKFQMSLYKESRHDLALHIHDLNILETILVSQFDAQTMYYSKAFPGLETFIIEKELQPIGRIILYLDKITSTLRIVDIIISIKNQKQGIGTNILETCIYVAKSKKLKLHLSVHKENTVARDLYSKLGFTFVATNGLYDELALLVD